MSVDRARHLAGRSLYTLGSGLASAGSLVARATSAGVQSLTADRSGKEEVAYLGFSALEWAAPQRVPVLLVGYSRGFQAWALDGDPRELVSRRDGPVRLLEAVPEPKHAAAASGALVGSWPLLAVVPGAAEPEDRRQAGQDARAPPDVVQFYSLQSHGYVHSLEFGSRVLAVRCSARLVVVALEGQLQAFDAATLQRSFTCPTFLPPRPPPPAEAQAPRWQPAPLALGPRWLAYAADLPVPSSEGQAVARRVPLGRRDSGAEAAGADASGSAPAQRFVGRSGQQMAAGVAAAGAQGVKYLSQRYAAWRSGGTAAQQQPDAAAAEAAAAAVAGTVVVRDVVTRRVLAHFRAHTCALAALRFDPEGALLATASVAGHSVNVFRLSPPAAGAGAGGGAYTAVHHLYRLYRGVTPGLIQGIAFAPDSAWVAVTSGRGTTHVFRTLGQGGRGEGGSESTTRGGGGAQGTPAGDGRGAAAGPAVDGVVGAPVKLAPVGRARRAGLLGSGLAATAASAAMGLVGQQGQGIAPAAAAFLPCPPGSPRGGGGEGGGSSLLVVTGEGLLTRHALSLALGAGTNAAARDAEGGTAAAAEAPAPPLTEAERWDVCRLHAWPEREEALPGPAAAAHPASTSGADLQLGVAQVEAVTHAGTPLWADEQFRFVQGGRSLT